MVLFQVVYRSRVSASESKGGMDMEVSSAPAVRQAHVRTNAASSAIRDLSVIKVNRRNAPSVVCGGGVVFASFAKVPMLENVDDSQLSHYQAYRRANGRSRDLRIQRGLFRTRDDGVRYQTQYARVNVSFVNAGRGVSNEHRDGIDSHRDNFYVRGSVSWILSNNVNRVDKVGVPFFHSRFFLGGFSCLLALSISDQGCGVAQYRVRRLRSALARVKLRRVSSFLCRGQIRFTLFYRRQFTFRGVLCSIATRCFVGSNAVLFHVFYPIGSNSVNYNVLLGLRRRFLGITIKMRFRHAYLVARFFPLKCFLTRLISLNAGRPGNLIIPYYRRQVFRRFFNDFYVLNARGYSTGVSAA